jgi:hypothetical protein
VSYSDHLERFIAAKITKLHLDQSSYITTSYSFDDCGRPELVARMPDIPGVVVVLNIDSGQVEIRVDKDAPYQVIAIEITLPPNT